MDPVIGVKEVVYGQIKSHHLASDGKTYSTIFYKTSNNVNYRAFVEGLAPMKSWYEITLRPIPDPALVKPVKEEKK
jgi:hypothetical protein